MSFEDAWPVFFDALVECYKTALRERLAVLNGGSGREWASGLHTFSYQWGRLTMAVTPELHEWLVQGSDVCDVLPHHITEAAAIDADREYRNRLLKGEAP